jgi:hypothetical protein
VICPLILFKGLNFRFKTMGRSRKKVATMRGGMKNYFRHPNGGLVARKYDPKRFEHPGHEYLYSRRHGWKNYDAMMAKQSGENTVSQAHDAAAARLRVPHASVIEMAVGDEPPVEISQLSSPSPGSPFDMPEPFSPPGSPFDSGVALPRPFAQSYRERQQNTEDNWQRLIDRLSVDSQPVELICNLCHKMDDLVTCQDCPRKQATCPVCFKNAHQSGLNIFHVAIGEGARHGAVYNYSREWDVRCAPTCIGCVSDLRLVMFPAGIYCFSWDKC